MFREKLHKDLDGISPSEELLSRVSLMMSEEAKKPKPPIYMNAVRWGGMAAAICLIAGSAAFFANNRGANNLETAAADTAGYSLEECADTAAPTVQAEDGADYAIEMIADGAADVYYAQAQTEEADDAVYYEEACCEAEADFAEADITEETSFFPNCDEAACETEEDICDIIFTVKAVRGGETLELSAEVCRNIYEIMCDYFTEYPNSMIDINLTAEQTDMYAENGLYISIDTPPAEEWLVLIDENSSFAAKNGEIFPLHEEYRDKIAIYFE